PVIGCSTLTTSAPHSARMAPATGTNTCDATSSTRTPSIGRAMAQLRTRRPRARRDRVELDLFGGICVRDFSSARAWYAHLFGREPAFQPHATEAVWELAEHRYLYIVEDAARAGHAVHLLYVDDLDARVREIAARGVEAAQRETYESGVHKVT